MTVLATCRPSSFLRTSELRPPGSVYSARDYNALASCVRGVDSSIGEGDPHRVVFALVDGHTIGECDHRGYRYYEWCAHLSTLTLAYVRDDVWPADLATSVEEELGVLWSARADGGEEIPRDGVIGGVRVRTHLQDLPYYDRKSGGECLKPRRTTQSGSSRWLALTVRTSIVAQFRHVVFQRQR